MLHMLDEILESYLRAEVPLPPAEIDVVFDRPDREWSASVTRPTVNIFMYDIRRNASDQEAGMEDVVENGVRVRRPPLPRIDCRYLVSAWAGETRDEHQLLGAVMSVLVTRTDFPSEYIPAPYSDVLPLPLINIARFDGSDTVDIWTAIEGDMRPALDLTVVATVDAAISDPAGPLVRRYELDTRSIDDPRVRSVRTGEGGEPPPADVAEK